MVNELSIRFRYAYDYLLSQEKVSGYKDFAGKLNISTSMITEIFKGRSSVGVIALQNIVTTFNIDGNWLLTGEGEMFRKNTYEEAFSPPGIPDFVSNIEKNESILYKLYKEKDLEVGDLKEMIGNLKARLELMEYQKQMPE